MSGLEIRIPYVSYKTRTKGFPYRINVQPTEMSIQKNLQYYSNKVMLKSNLQPLNTTENDIEWSIVDGSTYCSIDASTGELTIDSSAITQMVKVRAKSVSNSNLAEEREIVLTHREQPIIEDLNFDINISGLQASYNFIGSSTTYSFTAALDPSINGYNVVFDVIEGNDCFNITDINWENNQTTVTFAFNEPNEEDTVITLRFCLDKMKDFTKDVSFNVKTLVSDIIFDNIPEAPYIPYELYSFDFSTEPIINFRNLDVSVISGEEYLDNWYTGNVVGTSGKFYFKRNDEDILDEENIVFRFSDPLDENIYRDVSFLFENLNRRIEVYGNKSTYEYNSDKSFYENFTWKAIPNLRRLTITVTQNPENIINYNTSNVIGGTGQFNFQTKEITDEGTVQVRFQDPIKDYLRKDVYFNIRNSVISPYSVLDIYMNAINLISSQPIIEQTSWQEYKITEREQYLEFNYSKSSDGFNDGFTKSISFIGLFLEVFYESTIDEQTGRGVYATRHTDLNIDTQGLNAYDNIIVYNDLNAGLYFTNKNILYYSGDLFYSSGVRFFSAENGGGGHWNHYYGCFDNLVFDDIPRIKLECPCQSYHGAPLHWVTHIESRYMFFDPDNERVINYFNANPNKELVCQLVGDLNGDDNVVQLTADKIITGTGEYSYNDYFFLARSVYNDNDNINAWGWLMYAPEVIRFLEDQVSSINYNNIGKLMTSIFVPTNGWASIPGDYIKDMPKYVSSELEVIIKQKNQGPILNPNGLIRALEVGQEYNITLTQSIIENPEIEYITHIKINMVE